MRLAVYALTSTVTSDTVIFSASLWPSALKASELVLPGSLARLPNFSSNLLEPLPHFAFYVIEWVSHSGAVAVGGQEG